LFLQPICDRDKTATSKNVINKLLVFIILILVKKVFYKLNNINLYLISLKNNKFIIIIKILLSFSIQFLFISLWHQQCR